MKKTELLAPAGSYDSFVAALNAGADAVYAAGGKFGARAYAENFTQAQYLRAIDYAHMHGKKLYLTLNTLLKTDEFEHELDDYLLPLYEHGLDGVIVQDAGVLSHLHKYYPELPLHISTQMTVTGPEGAQLFKEQGAQRVVPARELSLEEITAIKRETGMEVEVFVHGALCYCYSGQCFFSSMLGGRSGNRGRCAQPCRLPYQVNGKTGYYLSPKDLCALRLLPALCEAGVDSFKIEGRMKSPIYTAGVVSVYRKYLDLYEKRPEAYAVEASDLQYLHELFDRGGTTEGYFYRQNSGEMIAVFRGGDYGVRGRAEAHTAALKPLCRERPAVKLNGYVSLHAGQPAVLSLREQEDAANDRAVCKTYAKQMSPVSISVTGDPVQEAQNQPLTEETVASQLTKTGGTFYELEELYCDMDGSVFMPKQALNRLRRDAVAALDRVYLSPFLRTAGLKERQAVTHTGTRGTVNAAVSDNTSGLPHTGYRIAASVETTAQLQAALESPYVSRIDIDSALLTERTELSQTLAQRYSKAADNAGKSLYLRFPPIFRKRQHSRFMRAADWLRQVFSGVVVRSADAFAFCIRRGLHNALHICCDFTLYAFQKEAAAFWRQYGNVSLTAPIELNSRELYQNRGLYDELIVYGRYPMMVSAGCLSHTLQFAASGRDGCNRSENVLYLTDRYHKQFPVKNFCCDCCNVIYNSVPLSLLDKKQAIDGLGVRVLRLLFTTENKAESARLLQAAGGADESAPALSQETTRGHFKRGVE